MSRTELPKELNDFLVYVADPANRATMASTGLYRLMQNLYRTMTEEYPLFNGKSEKDFDTYYWHFGDFKLFFVIASDFYQIDLHFELGGNYVFLTATQFEERVDGARRTAYWGNWRLETNGGYMETAWT